MRPLTPPRPPTADSRLPTPAAARLPWGEEQALLDQARALQRAALGGRWQPLLRGKHLGLLCDDDMLPAALMFSRAAGELGAQVAHVAVSLSEGSPAQEVANTARLLGRLYDAVECQGLAGALVQQIAQGSGIPVYDGIALHDAQLTRLALQLGPQAALPRNRDFALQALLLYTIV